MIVYLAEQFKKLWEMSLNGYAHLHGEQVQLVQFDFDLTTGPFSDVFCFFALKIQKQEKNFNETRNKSENKFVY